MSCANDLLANFDENCEVQINGIDDRLFIVPFNSIDKIATLGAFQKEPELLLTDLVMKENKSLFYCIGKSSVVPSTTFSRTTNSHQTKHEVRFKVFKDDPATRANLERLKEGKFLIIVQFADGTFDTYGLYQGMYMTEMPYTPADSATNRDRLAISGKELSENLSQKHLQASHFPCTGTDNKLQYPPCLPVES